MRHLLLLAVLALCACPSKPSEPFLSLSAPSSLPYGATGHLTVTALGAGETPGTGTVSLSATAGALSSTSVTLTALGSAKVDFVCAIGACPSTVQISASWSGLTQSRTVRIYTPPDGGVTDAGADAGSDGGADGGADGGTDGGSNPTADAGSDRFDPDLVWLIGSATPGACHPVVAALLSPNDVRLGFGCPLGAARLVNDRLIVLTGGALHAWAPDRLEGQAWPTAPEANDAVVTTPCDGGVDEFWAAPNGTLAVRCSSGELYLDGNRWDAGGAVVAISDSLQLINVGGTLNVASTNLIGPLSSVPAGPWSFRAAPLGFTLVAGVDGGCDRFDVSSTGEVTWQSTFAAPPAGVATGCGGGELALTADTLYTVGALGDGGVVVVARTVLSGDVVWTPPDQPSDFDTGLVSLDALEGSAPLRLLTGP